MRYFGDKKRPIGAVSMPLKRLRKPYFEVYSEFLKRFSTHSSEQPFIRCAKRCAQPFLVLPPSTTVWRSPNVRSICPK